jgi:Secretion system C-terminal sorting domain/PA domain
MQHQKILTAFVAVCLSVGPLAAQIVPQNRQDTIVLSVYNANQRFMLYQAPFGTPIPTTTVLVNMVAAFDTAFVWQQATVADSTGQLPMQQIITHPCDKFTGNVRDKVAIIRLNPTCDASQTFFNAQKAGAKAVILIHTTNSKDSVWLSPQSPYAFADSIRIPCYTVRREMGEKMSGLLPSLVGIARPDSVPSDIQALRGATTNNGSQSTTANHVGIGMSDVGNTANSQSGLGTSNIGNGATVNVSKTETPKADIKNATSAFSLSPNPANDMATLVFNLSQKTDLTLEILNEAGQMMFRRALQNAQTGSLDVDTRAWASGAYFIHLTDGKGVKTVKRLVVQH